MINKFQLFSNCIPVKGFRHSLLCDLQLKTYKSIPNTILEAICSNEITEDSILSTERTELEQYFVELGYGFFSDSPNNFPPLNLDWDYPALIFSSIIDLRSTSQQEFEKLIYCITQLDIPYLQLIINDNTVLDLNVIKPFINQSQTSVIEIILIGNKCNIQYNELEDFVKIDLIKQVQVSKKRLFVQENKNLTISIEHFTESQKHNTYFNRKLFIGANGEIKNAPECKEHFGFIQDIENAEELKPIIGSSKFQKYWFVKKDECDVCKDCELRHICIDNRVPTKRNQNEWYHKEECNYNPYLAKWKGEEGFQSVADCGIVSNEKTFSIDHDRVKSINTVLWDE